jgi:hypothetical protein
MDNMVLIMFACVIATVTALNFMELRKIRKHLQRSDASLATKRVGSAAIGESVRA